MENQTHVFYEINPSKGTKCCCHCKHWHGVMSCGECNLTDLDTMAYFECELFVEDTNEEKDL